MTDIFTPSQTGTLLATSVEQIIARNGCLPGRNSPEITRQLWRDIAEAGLYGIELAPEYGGAGGTPEDIAPAQTVLGNRLCTTPLVSALAAAGLIEALGSQQQKADWLENIAQGTCLAVIAHEEQAARGHPHFVETRAERSGTGWILNGEKPVIADGGDADLFIVSARLSDGPSCRNGIALFLIPAATSGLRRRKHVLYDGCHAADLSLEGLHLPDGARLGPAGGAADGLEAALDHATALLTAEAVGVMDGLFALTLDYVRTREQFGQPIGRFQVIQHRMADLHIELQQARSMACHAIAAARIEDAEQRRKAVSAAKYVISTAARTVGQGCVQMHGGIALTDEYAAGHYFKRLTRIERQLGTASYHLDRFAGLAA